MATPTPGPASTPTAPPPPSLAGWGAPPPPPTPGAAIELHRVSRWYGNVVALNDITFTLERGVTGLLGPNGAGKSTLLHCLSGLLAPSSGTLRIAGRAAVGDPSIYRQVGLVPEREAVPGFLTARGFMQLSADLQGIPDRDAAAQRALAMVDLADEADRPMRTFSKGMRQRAKVAAALVHDPAILLLDEPFNGMDPRQRLHMIELLRRMAADGKTILFSSHILEEVERLAGSVLVLFAGRLAASGDFRSIRRLMTDRPHRFTVRSSDDRRLAAMLLADPAVFGAELGNGALAIQTSDFGAFTRAVAPIASAAGIRILEIAPTDDSLESVFSYLVHR
jgi:ABC-2 type transport system ATP-binding protein